MILRLHEYQPAYLSSEKGSNGVLVLQVDFVRLYFCHLGQNDLVQLERADRFKGYLGDLELRTLDREDSDVPVPVSDDLIRVTLRVGLTSAVPLLVRETSQPSSRVE